MDERGPRGVVSNKKGRALLAKKTEKLATRNAERAFLLSSTVDYQLFCDTDRSRELFSASVENLSGCGVQNQPPAMMFPVKVEHAV